MKIVLSSAFAPLLLLLLVLTAVQACHDQHPDLVQNLPGYPQGAPPGRWFSGYLDFELEGQTVHTHYTLMTAESAFVNASSQPPLIYWSNGGPGASSLFGLLTELGPLLLSDRSLETNGFRASGIPTPIYNEYAWTRLGSLLSFDQPAPIGFSYCNDLSEASLHPHSCGGIAWTDELTAQAAYQALLAFYKKFPCYKETDLFLTGESYAGIYIPTFAREIVQNQNDIPLQGFAVGDGCLGTETGICGIIGDENDPRNILDIWKLVFLVGHGQIPMQSFRAAMKACYNKEADSKDEVQEDFVEGFLRATSVMDRNLQMSDDEECLKELLAIKEQVGGVYAYGLYDECTYSNGMLTGGLNDYPCGGDLVMADYLGRPDVKEALHVVSDFYSIDNAEGDFDYTPTEPDLRPFYKEMQGKLRMLIYNGDTDPAINSFVAQNWTSGLGFTEVQPWRPWTVDSCRRMGGYVTRYEGNFDYLTIRGATHMVPTVKAAAALTFMRSWILNTDYPKYDKDCDSPSKRKAT